MSQLPHHPFCICSNDIPAMFCQAFPRHVGLGLSEFIGKEAFRNLVGEVRTSVLARIPCRCLQVPDPLQAQHSEHFLASWVVPARMAQRLSVVPRKSPSAGSRFSLFHKTRCRVMLDSTGILSIAT